MPSGVQISGDDLATLTHTERWHDAMCTMGRAAVEAALRRRPGRPTDRIDDVGGEPPYPTRAFCEQWCVEQDNILYRFTPRTAVILTLIIAILACVVMAVGDFARLSAGSASGAGGGSAAAGDAPRSRVAPEGIFDVPAYRPIIPSQQQQQLQQQQQQQQQQMMQFRQSTQPTSPQ